MKPLLACAVLGASALMAQTAELHVYRAVMLPSNEVATVTLQGSAMTTVFVHVTKDNTGAVTSGSVDFLTHATFAVANTVTGLHIHAAPAGVTARSCCPPM